MYHQPLHSLCLHNVNTVSLNSYDLSISYVEEHDENTVEFPHSHPKEYEIYYVIEGNIDILVENKVHPITKNHFLFLNQGVKHGTLYKPNQKKSYLTVLFSIQERTSPCYNNGTEEIERAHIKAFFEAIKNKNYLICEDKFYCTHCVKAMRKEFTNKDWGWFYQLQFLYTDFILNVIRNFVPPINTSSTGSNRNLPIAFTKYLHANYQNPDLSLQDVADHFYMSPRHANRLFKEYFGASLSKTLTQYRISYAKNYLMDTDYSVDEIAEKVGFSSASTLSRLFKEIEGITISEYRYMCKKQKMLSESISDQ